MALPKRQLRSRTRRPMWLPCCHSHAHDLHVGLPRQGSAAGQDHLMRGSAVPYNVKRTASRREAMLCANRCQSASALLKLAKRVGNDIDAVRKPQHGSLLHNMARIQAAATYHWSTQGLLTAFAIMLQSLRVPDAPCLPQDARSHFHAAFGQASWSTSSHSHMSSQLDQPCHWMYVSQQKRHRPPAPPACVARTRRPCTAQRESVARAGRPSSEALRSVLGMEVGEQATAS